MNFQLFGKKHVPDDMNPIDPTNMCSHLQRKLFAPDGEYRAIREQIESDPTLTAVVRSRQLHIYRDRKKILVLAGKSATHVAEQLGEDVDAVFKTTLLHGDFTFRNLILSLDTDKAYWIDLGRATHGLPMFDLGHFWLFFNLFGKKQRVQDIAHMTDKQMVQFWNTFALAYNGPDNLDTFNAECKRFAALDVILLGHIQTLNWHECLFLGLLVKSLMK